MIAVPGGRRAGLAVVLDPGIDASGEPRPLVLTEDRWAGRLSAADFPAPGRGAGPDAAAASTSTTGAARCAATSRRRCATPASSRRPRRGGAARAGGAPTTTPSSATLRRALRAHPCHGCADREAHARWAERHGRLERETEQLRQKVRATTHSLARAFDRIRALLAERGYLAHRRLDGAEAVTDARASGWPGCGASPTCSPPSACGTASGTASSPAELAAVVSALVYESRRDDGPVPRVPTGAGVRGAGRDRAAVGRAGGRRAPAPASTAPASPTSGFAWPMYRWARGESLSAVLTAAEQNGAELSAGDFVRWCRQVLDLLDQIAGVAGRDSAVGRAASTASRAVRRGVVAVGTDRERRSARRLSCAGGARLCLDRPDRRTRRGRRR